MASFTNTVRISSRLSKPSEKSFLSCSSDPKSSIVDLWTSEDGSGRQKWVLTPSVPHRPNTYAVQVSGGRGGGATFLSTTPDGKTVDLYVKDDGSGRQKWEFKNVSGRTFEISIAAGGGLNDKSSKVLTLDPKTGKMFLSKSLSPSSKDRNNQLWLCEDVAPPKPVQSDAKIFVGSAFNPSQNDLAVDPNGWKTVASKSGFWAHPMGVGLAKDGGWLPQLLSRFGKKTFAYEMDLLAWSDGTNPIQTNTPSCWGDWIRQADPSFQCSFYAPWVAGDRLANLLDDTTNRYAQIRTKMDAAGYAEKGYFFYAPPCPESISTADTLLNSRRNGMCHVEYVTRTACLRGVAIDFPGSLYTASVYPPQFPPGSADKCRALAKQAFDVSRKLGIPFVWVMNGGEDGATITNALTAARNNGIVPDVVAVDNFADPTRRGTPETDARSVTGQTKFILSYFGI